MATTNNCNGISFHMWNCTTLIPMTHTTNETKTTTNNTFHPASWMEIQKIMVITTLPTQHDLSEFTNNGSNIEHENQWWNCGTLSHTWSNHDQTASAQRQRTVWLMEKRKTNPTCHVSFLGQFMSFGAVNSFWESQSLELHHHTSKQKKVTKNVTFFKKSKLAVLNKKRFNSKWCEACQSDDWWRHWQKPLVMQWWNSQTSKVTQW